MKDAREEVEAMARLVRESNIPVTKLPPGQAEGVTAWKGRHRAPRGTALVVHCDDCRVQAITQFVRKGNRRVRCPDCKREFWAHA